MGLLDSFGALASSIVAALIMLVFSIASLFVLVFIVDVAAGIAGLDPADDFVLQGAALLAAASILAGGVGFATPERTE